MNIQETLRRNLPALLITGISMIALPSAYAGDTGKVIAKELVAFPAVSYAVPSTSLERGTVPDNGLTRAVLNNYNAARSGNVYVVFNPGWFINDLDGLSVAVVHGSPWRYDTYVPILFAGYGIKPQKVSRRVHTVDVALTLATTVGTKPPSGAAGEVLLEVLGQ